MAYPMNLCNLKNVMFSRFFHFNLNVLYVYNKVNLSLTTHTMFVKCPAVIYARDLKQLLFDVEHLLPISRLNV